MKRFLPTSFQSLTAIGAFFLIVTAKTFLTNFFEFTHEQLSRIEISYFALGVVISATWLFFDKKAQHTPPNLLSGLAALIWPLGIPIYLVSTRGWGALTKLLLTSVILAAGAILGGGVGRTI